MPELCYIGGTNQIFLCSMGTASFDCTGSFVCCAKEADVGAHWRKEAGKVVACGKEVGTAGPCGNAACLGTTFGDKAAWGAP